MSKGKSWGRVTQIINGSAPLGAGLNITAVQKHTKHTLFRVFEYWDFGVQHCVSNLVKEHSIHEKLFGQTLIFLELMAQREL